MYWLEYWWLLPVALGICVLVCLVGVEGSLLFAPFYAVIFPWLSGVDLSPLQAIQIGLFTEIVGFSSSFVGFFRAGLIDFRLGLRTAVVGAPAAALGALLAYRLDEAVLLAIVALAMPALAWYIRHPPRTPENGQPRRRLRARTVEEAANRIPLCCYSSANLYTKPNAPAATGTHQANPRHDQDSRARSREHRDRMGNAYRYNVPGVRGQAVVGAAGGTSTGLIGFGVGVLGVAHLVISRVPMRIAVGTSHFVILLVTGVAVAMHLTEMHSSGITPPWNVVAVNATAVLFGGQLAAWLAGRVPEQKMRTILVVLLLVLTTVTFYRAASLAL